MQDLLIALVIVNMVSIALSNAFINMGQSYSFEYSNHSFDFTEKVYNQTSRIYEELNSTKKENWILTLLGVVWSGAQVVIANMVSVFDMLAIVVTEISQITLLPTWFITGMFTIAFVAFMFVIYNTLTGREQG